MVASPRPKAPPGPLMGAPASANHARWGRPDKAGADVPSEGGSQLNTPAASFNPPQKATSGLIRLRRRAGAITKLAKPASSSKSRRSARKRPTLEAARAWPRSFLVPASLGATGHLALALHPREPSQFRKGTRPSCPAIGPCKGRVSPPPQLAGPWEAACASLTEPPRPS